MPSYPGMPWNNYFKSIMLKVRDNSAADFRTMVILNKVMEPPAKGSDGPQTFIHILKTY